MGSSIWKRNLALVCTVTLLMTAPGLTVRANEIDIKEETVEIETKEYYENSEEDLSNNNSSTIENAENNGTEDIIDQETESINEDDEVTDIDITKLEENSFLIDECLPDADIIEANENDEEVVGVSDITVFSQLDDRWSGISYGKGPDKKTTTLGPAGCGVFAYINAIYYLNGSFIEPRDLASYSVNNGHRKDGQGTSETLYEAFARDYGASYGFVYDTQVETVSSARSYLGNGDTGVLHVQGHWVAIVDYDASTGKYLVLDSYKSSNRGTSPNGYRWMTESQFTGKMALSGKYSVFLFKSTLFPQIMPPLPPNNFRTESSTYASTTDSNKKNVSLLWDAAEGATDYVLDGYCEYADGTVYQFMSQEHIGNTQSYKMSLRDPGTYRMYIWAVNSYGASEKRSCSFRVVKGDEMKKGYDAVLPDGDYAIVSAADAAYYLDIMGTAKPAAGGTNVAIAGPDNGRLPDFELWSIKYSDGFYRISQKGTEVSLDVTNASTDNGANIQICANNSSSAQKWAISQFGESGGYRIQAKCSGFSLDITGINLATGTNVQQHVSNESEAQRWFLIPYGEQPLPDGDYAVLCAADPSYYLDIDGTALPAAGGTNVGIAGPNSGHLPAFEIWNIKYSDGFYRIRQKGTDMYLDVTNGSKSNGANIQICQSNGSNAQKWTISRFGDGRGYRVSSKCTGYSLDVTGAIFKNATNVQQHLANNSDAQSWLFIPYEPEKIIEEGRYVLVSGVDPHMVLDISGDSGNVPNGTNVQIWNDGAENKYNSIDVDYLGHGYYRLTHAASGKSLEVAGGSVYNAANIQLNASADKDNQKWAIMKNGDGYSIWSKQSGLLMDVLNAGKTDGTNVVQARYEKTVGRIWHFEQAEYKVTFDANGGSGAPAAQTKYYANTLTLSSTKPAMTGRIFKGWATSKNAVSPNYQAGGSYMDNKDVTLYAVWSNNGVTGVSLNASTVTMKKGEAKQLTATVSPADALDKTVSCRAAG